MNTIQQAHILLVDDNTDLLRLLEEQLRGAGYQNIRTVQNCAAAQTAFAAEMPELMILDINLPDGDGFSLFRTLRAKADVPTLFLSARDADADRLFGLGLGADDYLTKPFNILELKARIRALLRRAGRTEEKAAGNSLTIGTITLDLDARNAYRNGQLADLTAKEFDVIEFLMRNPNRVYSREALLDTIWAYEYRSDIRTVDVHIKRLREKLEGVSDKWALKTVWGVGYKFEAEET